MTLLLDLKVRRVISQLGSLGLRTVIEKQTKKRWIGLQHTNLSNGILASFLEGGK